MLKSKQTSRFALSIKWWPSYTSQNIRIEILRKQNYLTTNYGFQSVQDLANPFKNVFKIQPPPPTKWKSIFPKIFFHDYISNTIIHTYYKTFSLTMKYISFFLWTLYLLNCVILHGYSLFLHIFEAISYISFIDSRLKMSWRSSEAAHDWTWRSVNKVLKYSCQLL